MDEENQNKLDKDTCVLICPISAGMIGVCMTTIGLIRVVITINKIDTLADDLLSLTAFIFLVSTLTSYIALRTRGSVRMHRLEKVADITFMAGMSLMVAACLFVTYAIS